MTENNSRPGWDGVIIRRFISMADAHGFQAFLESLSITSYLLDDHMSSSLGVPHLINGGMGVLVSKEELNDAKKAMKEYDKLMAENENQGRGSK